jgi:hypothetical protein
MVTPFFGLSAEIEIRLNSYYLLKCYIKKMALQRQRLIEKPTTINLAEIIPYRIWIH